MDDLPLEKIQISGPSLASMIQRFSFSPGDVDGLLFGRVTHINPSNFSDEDPTTTTSSSTDSPTLVATITSFFCSNSTTTFYDSTGQLNVVSLRRLLSSHRDRASNSPQSLIGWFSGRLKTPLRPSMRESSVTSSLSSEIQFSFQVENSPKSYTLSPCIFLLLTTPIHDQLIHTHEYRAFQFRLSTDSFEPRTLDVINIGTAFRGHYGAFCPNSPFPALSCEWRGLHSSSMFDDSKSDSESLKSMRRISKDQKKLDMCAEGFEVGRLSRLMGSDAANYTQELEELYNKMLVKLDGLARLVEKSSARVLELENHNMKLRYKVAGLE
uniref:Putative BRCA1-A complex subunit Abraxas n=1 Tax=Davidia involucrata TaxID=16924 RepID=A0A5B7B790_DAVIN